MGSRYIAVLRYDDAVSHRRGVVPVRLGEGGGSCRRGLGSRELETCTVCHRGFVSLLAMEVVRVPDEVVVGTEHERALAPVLAVTFVHEEHAVILKRLTEFGFVWHDVVGWRDGCRHRD